jgi:hypothetical protein
MGMMMATMRVMLRDHDISMPSTHLLMISKLVNFIQGIQPEASADWLVSMIDIYKAHASKTCTDEANAKFAEAHTKLLYAFDLFFAQPQDGGRA